MLLALPLAVPEFVNGYAWVGLDDRVHGLWGAVLVSTLSYYPLVMLPGDRQSARRADPALEDVARSQGLRPLAVFARVTLPQLRLALLGGGLIIALHLLAEYGAFALLGFRTFTTEIYAEYQLGFDAASSAVLSLVLVAFCLLLLGAESGLQGRTPPTLRTAAVQRRSRLGLPRGARVARARRARGARLGVPLGALVYWLIVGSSTTLPLGLDHRRGRLDRRARLGGGADHDARGDPGRGARGPLSDAPGAPARAQRLPRARHAGPDHRAGARVLRRAPRVRALPVPACCS